MRGSKYICVTRNPGGNWEATGVAAYQASAEPESVINDLAADGYELVLWDGARYWLETTERDSLLQRDEKEAMDEAGLPEKTLDATAVAK
jgi:hypothetical protein